MMNPNSKLMRAAGAMLFCLAAARAGAQEPQRRQIEQFPPPAVRSDDTGTLSPQTAGETGETTDLGPQLVLQRRTRAPLLALYSDTQYLFDSNVGLAPDHQLSDAVFFETLGATFTPHLLDNLTSAVYVRQQFVRYDEHSILDFDAQTAGLSLSYPVQDWFTVYGGFAATRLYTRQDEHEFYKEFDTQFGLWRSQPLGPRLSFYYGYQLDWLPAHPADLTQVDNALYAGLNLSVTDHLAAQFLYRFRVREYLTVDRTDLDHFLSLALTYTFNQYVSVRAYASYGDNDSNRSQFDYNVANAGGGLNLSVRF